MMLKELHGENPIPQDLILIYTTGIFGTLALVIYLQLESAAFSTFQWFVLCVVTLDVIAGAVANMTCSTNQFYRSKPPYMSWVFLALHIVHPTLLAWILPDVQWSDMLLLYGYMLLGSLIVLSTVEQAFQKSLATALVVLGVVLASSFSQLPIYLIWFPPVYLMKLVAAFSVTHYPLEGQYEQPR